MKQRILDIILEKEDLFLPYEMFIEMALYDPDEGYYHRRKDKFGVNGDFYTSVTMSSVFGEFLGKWAGKKLAGSNLPPIICELGGGTGKMAHHFLKGLEIQNPQMASEAIYYIVESSYYHRDFIMEIAAKDQRIQLLSSLKDMPVIEGIIFSNEFFDAFPVHVLARENGCWKEAGLTVKNDELVETTREIRDPIISSLIDKWKLPEFMNRVEVPIPMIHAYRQVVEKLERGYLMTIDYGMEVEDLYVYARKNGTLRGFKNHQLVDSILDNPGQVDITSTVNFSLLKDEGRAEKLNEEFWGGQQSFLLEHGILNELESHSEKDPFTPVSRRNRQIRQLVLGDWISDCFNVLIQSRNIKKP